MTEKKEIKADEVNSFVKKLADLADKYKIAVHNLTPKFVDTSGLNLIEQEYTLQTQAKRYLKLYEMMLFATDWLLFLHVESVIMS